MSAAPAAGGDLRKASRLAASPEAIAAFCLRWQVVEFGLFGSVLRDDFGPDSDVDVLVRFADTARPTLLDLDDMERELEALFGCAVDLVSRRGVEQSRNTLRRRNILDSVRIIHAG